MTYSYTQISQYLICPRRYRHRYVDGWRERDSRASMMFGRAFEKALAAYFLGSDPGAILFQEWQACREMELDYPRGESWDGMLYQGIRLLERLIQDGRVEIDDPERNLQVKLRRALSNGEEFVGYLDAIGTCDQIDCLIEWKTTGARYPEAPEGLLALDPQLIAYSWLTGISEVAMVVFVRKKAPEIQYLRASISDQLRDEYERLVEQTVAQINAGCFPPHSGIRFPQNGCLSCPFVGLCLENTEIIDEKLIRQPGAGSIEWLDEVLS